ncbi:hypothetical protein OZN62_07710 [Aurantiacibacter sp. MUD11]|uniref:hypothetical protein n=1 Tax=Aurantiacibacter sp. MUD11 TaxID=3003265 RepID=UPI0022AA65D6|nr:hypothetical protein [Aurantiacibacter sp. MUD11]WAT16832.1 hypothetical protein OZN62_07710 [Aurantiacibacter sp. MUD11]
MNALLDRVIEFEARHEKVISIALGLWFWAGVAVYARFISLPDIPGIDEQAIFFWGSAAFNALWWGFARPAMVRHKQRRMAEGD